MKTARSAVTLAALSFALLYMISCTQTPPPSVVVVFVLDTLRQDALGCYGNPLDPTPNIDSLDRDGTRFDQAISSSGWTLPAVASLLTGTWPTLHGAMGKNIRLLPIRSEIATAAEVFKQNGFRTVGIANAAFVSPLVGIDRGFDVFDHKYSYNFDARPAREIISLAIEQLHARGEGSSFFLVHLFDPHLNYDPPSEWATKYTQSRTSPPLPLTMDTCLKLQTGPGNRGSPQETDVNYVRAIYQGEVSYLDVMPTLFDALGLPKPASFEGMSMMPLLRGEPDVARPAFSESTLYGSAKIAWRTERYKYIHDPWRRGAKGWGSSTTGRPIRKRPTILRASRSNSPAPCAANSLLSISIGGHVRSRCHGPLRSISPHPVSTNSQPRLTSASAVTGTTRPCGLIRAGLRKRR